MIAGIPPGLDLIDSCGRKRLSNALILKWQLSPRNTSRSHVLFCQHLLEEQISSDLHHEAEENRVGKELQGNASK